MSSTIARYTLSITIIYLPSRGEDGLITITSVALGDLLLTQLGSDNFLSPIQEDVAQINALIIDATAITTTTPALTPPPTLLPMTSPSYLDLSPNFTPNIARLSLQILLRPLPPP